MGIVLDIMCMSMTAGIGILMLVFACAYSKFQTSKGACWILFVVLFYILVPIPRIIQKRLYMVLRAIVKDEVLNAWIKKNRQILLNAGLIADFMLFLKSGLVLSSFVNPPEHKHKKPHELNLIQERLVALPVVMAKAQIIKWGAVGATIIANIFIYLTMHAFFKRLERDSGDIHIKVDLTHYTKGRDAIWNVLKQMGKSEAVPKTPY